MAVGFVLISTAPAKEHEVYNELLKVKEIVEDGVDAITAIKEKRPFPVSSEVVMRSALFALANLNAKLQGYNEENGVIVASVSKWLGMSKQEVIVKVRRFDETSILEVEAPVQVGQVLLSGLLGEEGVDVVATRSMQRVEPAPSRA